MFAYAYVPILTGSSAYAIAEALGWKHGLDEKPRRAKLFYAMIIVSTLIGMLLNFVGINVCGSNRAPSNMGKKVIQTSGPLMRTVAQRIHVGGRGGEPRLPGGGDGF